MNPEKCIPFPNKSAVEQIVPKRRLPYIAAKTALQEVIYLRMEGASHTYSKKLREAVDEVAGSSQAFDPPLPTELAAMVTELSASLQQNDEVQSRRFGMKHTVPYGFLDVQQNAYDTEGMAAAELALAAVVDYGDRRPPVVDDVHILDQAYIVNGGQ